jgi:hypothetical protein
VPGRARLLCLLAAPAALALALATQCRRAAGRRRHPRLAGRDAARARRRDGMGGPGVPERQGPEGGDVTEAEWDGCDDPQKMLLFLRGQVSDRKLRLFACALGRRLWGKLGREASRRAVQVAERHAPTGRRRRRS